MKKLTFAILVIATTILGITTRFVEAARPQKITSGQKVIFNEFPYLVSLRLPLWWNLHHFCGGSIISELHILTAAHCIKDKYVNEVRVVLGTNHLQVGGEVYSLKSMQYPNNYRGTPDDQIFLYDIAILTLDRPLVREHNSSWKMIKLASKDYPTNSAAVVAGWGDTHYKSKRGSNDLLHIHTHLFDSSLCNLFINMDIRHHLCTFASYGAGTCQGDSGGPLVVNNEVVGIVSYGKGCGIYPSVYTKVRAYKDFIKRVTGIEI